MNPFADPLENHKWPSLANYSIIENEIDPDKIQGVVFCVTHRLPEFFQILPEVSDQIVLMSSQMHGRPCSDYNTHEAYVKRAPMHRIWHWYARNLQVRHPDISPLPIGLVVGNKISAMEGEFNRAAEKKHTMYCNFEINTNHGEREPAHTHALEVKGAKVCSGRGHTCDFYQYIRDVRESHFVLCPPGSGIDTWRLWEALYLGSIPIVQRSAMTETYSQIFPMVLIDFWEELKNFEHLEVSTGIENWRDALTLEWWRNKICTA